MSRTPARASRLCRAGDAARSLGVGVVLIAFWGTTSVAARWCTAPQRLTEESVRRKG